MQHYHLRSIWVSDTHLGGGNLKSTESDNLCLGGDVFNQWKLSNSWHWPEINDHIVKLIINKARNGTKVYYLPGNHDDIVRRHTGTSFHGVQICEEIVYASSVDGKRYLALHGYRFDSVGQNSE